MTSAKPLLALVLMALAGGCPPSTPSRESKTGVFVSKGGALSTVSTRGEPLVEQPDKAAILSQLGWSMIGPTNANSETFGLGRGQILDVWIDEDTSWEDLFPVLDLCRSPDVPIRRIRIMPKRHSSFYILWPSQGEPSTDFGEVKTWDWTNSMWIDGDEDPMRFAVTGDPATIKAHEVMAWIRSQSGEVYYRSGNILGRSIGLTGNDDDD